METHENNLSRYNFAIRRRLSHKPIYIQMEHYPYKVKNADHFHDFPQLWYCIDGEFSISVKAESENSLEKEQVISPPKAKTL